MKFKAIFKKAWLPVLTVLVIGVAALVLANSIESNKNGQMAQDVVLLIEDYGNYQYHEILAGRAPRDGEISYEQAGQYAVQMFKKMFGDDFTSDETDIYVRFQTYTGIIGDDYSSYIVTVGSRFFDGSTFMCFVDSCNGATKYVSKHTPLRQQTKSHTFDDVDEALMEASRSDSKVVEAAIAFVNEKLAAGRTVLETEIPSISWEFEDPNYDVFVTCCVRMNEGECYRVELAYPSCEIIGVSFYPLGWHSCLHGYYYEEQASEYPPLDE